ncbi:aldehyde dehydrogenase family protein [Actinocorallia herbida]|uniref:aldehyde dehydrogenase family protein n=1 Tax=Actinocorallia herbida TaxID=58109 RepID=UPI0026B40D97
MEFGEVLFGEAEAEARFRIPGEAVRLAVTSEYGLSLGIVTRDAMRGWEFAQRVPTGVVHINDRTVNDEANAPFGGVAASGTGSRFGGPAANVEAFTETRWITMRAQAPTCPF